MSTPALPPPPKNTHWAKGPTNGGGLHDWLGKIPPALNEIASRSGTSVAGNVEYFADLPSGPALGQSWVVRVREGHPVPHPALYTWSETLQDWSDPVSVAGAATEAAVAAVIPATPVRDALIRDVGGLVPVTRLGVRTDLPNTDQSAEIQAAIDTGLPLFFPAARYIANNLVARRGMHLVGAGKGHPDEPASPRTWIRCTTGPLFASGNSMCVIEHMELQGFGSNAGDIITGMWSVGAFRTVRFLQYRLDRHCLNVTGWIDMVIEGESEIMTQPLSTVPAFKGVSSSGAIAQLAFRDVRMKGGGGNTLSPQIWLEGSNNSASGVTGVTISNVNFEIPHGGCIRLLSTRNVHISGCGAWDLHEATAAHMIYIGKSPTNTKESGQITIDGWMRDATTPPTGMDIRAESGSFDLNIVNPSHQTLQTFRVDAGGARGRIFGKNFLLTNGQNMSTDYYLSYSPTVSPTVVGDGTLTGRYKRSGDYIHAQITLSLGSTSNVGNMLFTLPVPAIAGFAATAVARDADAGNYYNLPARLASSTVQVSRVGTDGLMSNITGSLPFPWAAGDTVHVDVCYRAST